MRCVHCGGVPTRLDLGHGSVPSDPVEELEGLLGVDRTVAIGEQAVAHDIGEPRTQVVVPEPTACAGLSSSALSGISVSGSASGHSGRPRSLSTTPAIAWTIMIVRIAGNPSGSAATASDTPMNRASTNAAAERVSAVSTITAMTTEVSHHDDDTEGAPQPVELLLQRRKCWCHVVHHRGDPTDLCVHPGRHRLEPGGLGVRCFDVSTTSTLFQRARWAD